MHTLADLLKLLRDDDAPQAYLAALAKCSVVSETDAQLELRAPDAELADYLAHNLQALLGKPVEIQSPGVIVRCNGGPQHRCTLMDEPLPASAKGAAA